MLRHPEPVTEAEPEKNTESLLSLKKEDEIECEKIIQNVISPTSAMSKKKRFSFKYGKLSMTEVPAEDVITDNVYLEVEGKEIAVKEAVLMKNSRHMSRIFDDVSVNSNSEYLLPEEGEEDEEEEAEEDHSFARFPMNQLQHSLSLFLRNLH